MRLAIPRFIIENNGASPGPAESALEFALEYAVKGNISDLTLLVNTKGSVPDAIANKLGPQRMKILRKSSLIQGKPNIRLEGVRTFSPQHSRGVVLGVYVERDVLDNIVSADAIVFLPWAISVGQEWMATWSPKTIGPKTWNAATVSLPQEAEDALTRVETVIHVETGLANSNDRTRTREIFRELKAKGVTLDLDMLRIRAVQRGWMPKHADELRSEAARIFK